MNSLPKYQTTNYVNNSLTIESFMASTFQNDNLCTVHTKI